jgi:hypothetical protein
MSDLLEKLYDINFKVPVYQFGEALTANLGGHLNWAGGRLRRMLQCIYVIAFLCLLRFDEVLNIEAHQLEIVSEVNGQIKLTLPFRKTHQHGGTYSQLEFNIANDDQRSSLFIFTIM